MYDMASDEEVGRQILSIFMQHKVGASGLLRRERCRFPTRVEEGRRESLDQDQIARSLHLRTHRSWSCCGIERWASAEAFKLMRARCSFGRRRRREHMSAPVVPNQFEVGKKKIVHKPTKAAFSFDTGFTTFKSVNWGCAGEQL